MPRLTARSYCSVGAAFIRTGSSDRKAPPDLAAFMREYKELTVAPLLPPRGETGLRTRLWISGGEAIATTILSVSGINGYIRLHDITSLVRGQGYGTQILTRLTTLADKHGVTVCIRAKPDRDSPLNITELIAWCCRHGFKVDRGRSCVYRGRKQKSTEGSQRSA